LGGKGSGPRVQFDDEFHKVQRKKVADSRAKQRMTPKTEVEQVIISLQKIVKELNEIRKVVKSE